MDLQQSRPMPLEPSKVGRQTTSLKRKGSTLQTSVEVLKCKFGNKHTAEGNHQFIPTRNWTPLYHAVYHQRDAALAHFLKAGESPNDTTGIGVPPLCVAVAGGNAEIVTMLLRAGANINAATQADNETALHIAIKLNRSDLITILTSRGPDLQTRTIDGGETPLHYAAAKSASLATVVSLLKLGAKYDTLNTKGQTPAEAALLANNLHAAVAIINAAPRKHSNLTKEKEMLLKHVQKTQGRFSIGNDLIADIFSAACDPKSTVLVEAIKRDDACLVEMFLEKGSDPDRQTTQGERPIFVALECAGAPVIQTLAKHKVDVLVRDAKGFSVLQAAFDSPLAQDNAAIFAIFESLLTRGANPTVTFADGQTLLHRAVSSQFGNSKVANLLITAGVKVNAHDKDGNTALHLATHSRTCTEILLKNGADPHITNHDNVTPIILATSRSTQECENDLEVLIKASDLRKTNSHGQTPLHIAAFNGLEKAIRSLLQARADTTIVDENKNTPLLTAVKRQQWAIIPLLTIPPSINSWDAQGMSALHHIAQSVPVSPATWADVAFAAAAFCERGVSRSMRDRSGATPLIQAVKTLPEEGLPIVETLLEQKPSQGGMRNCVSHEDHQKRDALYYAVAMGKTLFVESLLKHGAIFDFKELAPISTTLDLNIPANRQILTLHAQYEWARRAGSLRRNSGGLAYNASTLTTLLPVKDVEQMISMGLDVNVLPKSPLGTSMLWAILRHVSLQPTLSSEYLFDIMKLILESGADPNAGTCRGTKMTKRSPLPASQPGSRDTVVLPLHPLTFLLEEHPTVDFKLIVLLTSRGAVHGIASSFYNGRSPLHSAVKAGRLDLVNEFLRLHVDANVEDNDRQTPLHIASATDSLDIVGTLLRHGGHPDSTDCVRNTPLHVATSKGSMRAITALLRAGAKANVKNAKGISPLQCIPDNLKEEQKKQITLLLNDAEQKEIRASERQEQILKPNAAYEAHVKHQPGEQAKAKLTSGKHEEELPPLVQEAVAHVHSKLAIPQNSYTSNTTTTCTTSKPLRQNPIFKKSATLFGKSKILPTPTPISADTTPKPVPIVTTMRLTTPPTRQLDIEKDTLAISQSSSLTEAPQHLSAASHDPTKAQVLSRSTTLSVRTNQKPPRIDSCIGQSKPLPLVYGDQNAFSSPNDAIRVSKTLESVPNRESGHELKDWLAMSRLMENL